MDSQIWRAREKAPWRQSSSSSSNERQWQVGMEEQGCGWSSSERKVMRAVENYLESSAELECLIEPEEEKVCLRYILKYSTSGRSNIFQIFETSDRKGPPGGKQNALAGAPKRNCGCAREVAK